MRVADLLRRTGVDDADDLIQALEQHLPWWGSYEFLSDGSPARIGLKVVCVPGAGWGRYASAVLTITSLFPQHSRHLTVQCGPVQFGGDQLLAAPDQSAPCECRGWKCPNCDPEAR